MCMYTYIYIYIYIYIHMYMCIQNHIRIPESITMRPHFLRLHFPYLCHKWCTWHSNFKLCKADPMAQGASKVIVGRKRCACTPCSALQGIRDPTAAVPLVHYESPLNWSPRCQNPLLNQHCLGFLVLGGRGYLSSCTGSSTTVVSRPVEFCPRLHSQAQGILLCIWIMAAKKQWL